MGPLGFVNWRLINARFCALMWIAAAVLAWVLLMHLARAPVDAAGHASHVGRYRSTAS